MPLFIPLFIYVDQIIKHCPEAFHTTGMNAGTSNPKVVKTEEKGLSELVKIVLHKPLDKSEQVSDWERRPLRRSQITYAGIVDTFELCAAKKRIC